MEQNGSEFGLGSVILSAVVGGILGAGIAMLMAPRSGRETRTKIKGLARDTKGKVGNYVGNAQEKAGSYMQQGRSFFEKEKSAFSKGVEAGKEAYRTEKNL